MSAITSLSNHQIRLASRPVGLPTRDNWSFTTEPVAEPGPGGVLVKTLYLSLDPAMRGWMNDAKSYIPPVEPARRIAMRWTGRTSRRGV